MLITNSFPKVSVVLPVHNGMPYLKHTIESLLAQSFSDFEIIAIDDGSTDETSNYLQAIVDDKLQYHRLEKKGLVFALNYGLSISNSALIARIDADDIALPNRLEEQYAQFQKNSRLIACSSHFERIETDGTSISIHENLLSDNAIRFQLLFTPPFLHPGVMFKRQSVLEVGAYSDQFGVAEDYDLWTRLASQGELCNIPKVLMKYRANPKGVSSNNREKQSSQTSEIASRYAIQYCKNLDVTVWHRLHRFITQGEVVEEFNLLQLTSQFDIAVGFAIQELDNDDSELEHLIFDYYQQLGWRIAEYASKKRLFSTNRILGLYCSLRNRFRAMKYRT